MGDQVEIFKEGLPDEVVLEQKCEGGDGVSHVDICSVESFQVWRSSWYQDPEVGLCLAYLRNSEEAGVEWGGIPVGNKVWVGMEDQIIGLYRDHCEDFGSWEK